MRTGSFGALTIAVLLGSETLMFATPPGGTGAITGKVTYTGTPPRMKPIDMSKEPSCAKQHTTPLLEQTVTTGPGNSLQWVLVYIAAGDSGSTAPSQAVKYEQKGCQYIPHVLPMQVAQELQIYNHDQIGHNIHPQPKINPEWNKSQPAGAPPIGMKFQKAEFIPVKCNIHSWMHGYFVVLNTSHYAVSGPDGSFDIKALPPGKYTVTAWQERYPPQSQEVTISGDETKTVDFVFKISPK
jgi:plastocyanin